MQVSIPLERSAQNKRQARTAVRLGRILKHWIVCQKYESIAHGVRKPLSSLRTAGKDRPSMPARPLWKQGRVRRGNTTMDVGPLAAHTTWMSSSGPYRETWLASVAGCKTRRQGCGLPHVWRDTFIAPERSLLRVPPEITAVCSPQTNTSQNPFFCVAYKSCAE